MGKMFYTLEETRKALGRSVEEIQALVKQGRLREYRDRSRVMFQADSVERVRVEATTRFDDEKLPNK